MRARSLIILITWASVSCLAHSLAAGETTQTVSTETPQIVARSPGAFLSRLKSIKLPGRRQGSPGRNTPQASPSRHQANAPRRRKARGRIHMGRDPADDMESYWLMHQRGRNGAPGKLIVDDLPPDHPDDPCPKGSLCKNGHHFHFKGENDMPIFYRDLDTEVE